MSSESLRKVPSLDAADKQDPDATARAKTVEVFPTKPSADSSLENPPPAHPRHFSELEVPPEFKLYRRRWIGLAAIVLCNIISGCNGQFFGPISVQASEDFGISLTRMNWLSNAVNLVYLPASFITSWILKRFGVRITLILGGVYLIIASWIRVASIAPKLDANGSYAFLLIAQLFVAFAQPCVQIIGVKYSELWFDTTGRLTSTMFIAIANPLGGVVASLLLPAMPTTNWAIIAGAILASVICPLSLLVQSAPPTPPTYAGSKTSPPMKDTFKAWLAKVDIDDPSYMEVRDRIDFGILFIAFGILCSATTTWANFSNQIFSPHGYTASRSGLFDATLLGAGVVASIVSAPLFDRYLSKWLGIMIRVLLPIIAACWVSFIWLIKPDNAPVLFPLFAIIGICSFILLPIGLELAAEVTRNAESSCALLWFSVNAFSFIFIFVEDSLRAGADATPPNNMFKAIIFNGSMVAFASALICVGFRGKQTRREVDLQVLEEAQHYHEQHPETPKTDAKKEPITS